MKSVECVCHYLTGAVVQLVERNIRIVEVRGSTPLSSIYYLFFSLLLFRIFS